MLIVQSMVEAAMTGTATRAPVGDLLREWRRRRRRSQMDLALDAGISTRHLSFVETGRSRPSADMVLRLAEELGVPLRDRNDLLLAAGYAPVYRRRPLDDPEMEPIRAALQVVLDGHAPNPALAVDQGWNLVGANDALALITDGVAAELLEPPVNVLRVALHPRGLAPRIANLTEWRGHLLERLGRQVALSADPDLAALLEELEALPGGDGDRPPADPATALVVPLRMRDADGRELTFVSTVTTFGTALDLTAAELSVESFFPADAATAEALRRAAG